MHPCMRTDCFVAACRAEHHVEELLAERLHGRARLVAARVEVHVGLEQLEPAFRATRGRGRGRGRESEAKPRPGKRGEGE
jgi:hypothetical protein